MLRFILRSGDCRTSLLHVSNRFGPGDSSLAPAGGGSETQAPPPQTEPDRPIVQDSVTQCLDPLGRGAADREAGDCGELASRRISSMSNFQAGAQWDEPEIDFSEFIDSFR